MDQVVGRALVAAASEDRQVGLDELGSPESALTELVALARDPLAPLAAKALVEGIRQGAEGWAVGIAAFARGLQAQDSVLALQDSVDALLSDGDAARTTGSALHDSMLDGLHEAILRSPYIAAARLEAAFRVVLAGLSRPYQVLDCLAAPIGGMPDGYVETLPRMLGIALETWPGDEGLAAPLVALLDSLLDTAADADAAHEIACRRMRLALSSADADQSVGGLAEARALFRRAEALDETREDSIAYGAACEAVVAFAEGDSAAVADAASSLAVALSRRDAWHLGTYQPAWRSGARDAEIAWLALVMDLRQAAERLGEDSWLDALAAVGQLAAVYEAERTLAPAPGLAAAIRPQVISGIAANAVLVNQLSRVVEADSRRPESVLPSVARTMLNAARRSGIANPRAPGEGSTTNRDAALGRVRRLAPSLLILGDDACVELHALNDEALADAEAVAAPLAARRMPDHPTLGRMREAIVATLEVNARFVGETRAAMVALLERTLTFLLDRYDRGGPLVPGKRDIIGKIRPGESVPVEADLQYEFYVWLAATWEFAGRVKTEVSDVSTGRVDVTVRFGEIELVTEVKRELADASPTELERRYLPQAAQYSGSGEPFSQLLVLDLTDHTAGVRPLSDLAWTVERRVDANASPQHVVVAVVVGNRPTPGGLKTLPAIPPGPTGVDDRTGQDPATYEE